MERRHLKRMNAFGGRLIWPMGFLRVWELSFSSPKASFRSERKTEAVASWASEGWE